jgi:signal transduction histidine kinase
MYRADDRRPPPRRGLLLASLTAAAVALAGLTWAWLSTPSPTDGSAATAAATVSHGLDFALMAALAAAAGFGCWWLLSRGRSQARPHDPALQPQQLLGLLDVWFWQTDRQHRVVRWRAPAGSAWPEPPLGRPLQEVLRHAAAHSDNALQHSLQGEAALTDWPLLLPDTDGRMQQWLLRCRPRLDAQGRFDGHDGTLRCVGAAPAPAGIAAQIDASAQAALWAEADADAPGVLKLRHANAAAAELLGAAPGELAGQPLARRPLASMGADAAEQESFSYTVSHDLRAPIRVVEGFTKILKEDYGRVLDRIGNDHLDRVLGAAARMNGMIDAMLALSRLSAKPLTYQPVNLSQLAGFVVEDLRRQQPERQAEVRIAPDVLAHGDPILLRVALENLLGNAWKYTSRSAVPSRIEFGVEERPLPARSNALRASRVYFVRDNGAGFDMRFAERLFGVFQRLHGASDFPGTGVGLATVRRIVQRHGGEIWAEAEVDRGATFYFTLG